MDSYRFSGYPTRDSIPRGYIFYQFVSNFRASGGYGSLVPQRMMASPPPDARTSQAAEAIGGPSGLAVANHGGGPPGLAVTKQGGDLPASTIAKAAEKASDAIEEVTTKAQEAGEFDATEGEAELKWRDPNAR